MLSILVESVFAYDDIMQGYSGLSSLATISPYLRDSMDAAVLKGIWAYYRAGKTIYKVQSPRAYHFLSMIMDTTTQYYRWADIEAERYRLTQTQDLVDVLDFGAGSRVLDRQRSVAQIAKTSVSPPHQCQQLYRAVRALKPLTTLEMGTSLGVSASYLSTAAPKARVITLEGDPQIADLARDTLRRLDLQHVDVRTGRFTDTLQGALDDLGQVDLAFIDGHHNYAATMSYTRSIMPFTTPATVLVYDDIYWSEGMRRAWSELKQLPSVSMSIDTYSQGYLFFDESRLQAQHITYVPMWAKPWQIGIFQ